MEPKEFCYWLQGFAEISGENPSPEQWEVIKEHLGLVFNKVTAPKKGVEITEANKEEKKSRPFHSHGSTVLC